MTKPLAPTTESFARRPLRRTRMGTTPDRKAARPKLPGWRATIFLRRDRPGLEQEVPADTPLPGRALFRERVCAAIAG